MESRMLISLCLIFSAQSAWAAESGSVRWYGDVNEAWKTAQTRNCPMLVFVTRTDCLPCAKMKVSTFVDRDVASALNENFVAVAVDAARPSPLLKDLAVVGVPATFVISPSAVILERLDGYVPPEKLIAKLSQHAPPAAEPAQPAIRTVSERSF